MAVANAFDQVLEIADAAGSNHRHGHRIGHRAGGAVGALPRAVAVHRGEQVFTGPSETTAARSDCVGPVGLRARWVRIPRSASPAADLLGVDGDDGALIAVSAASSRTAPPTTAVLIETLSAPEDSSARMRDGARAADGDQHKHASAVRCTTSSMWSTVLVAHGESRKLSYPRRPRHRRSPLRPDHRHRAVVKVRAFDDPASTAWRRRSTRT